MEGGERRELTANGFGGFYGDVEPDETFYYARTLTEAVDAPTLQIDAYDRAIAVYLDGECLYSDVATDAGIGEVELAELGWTRSAPVLVTLPADYRGKDLTIAQSGGAAEIDAGVGQFMVFPCAVRLGCGYSYESGLISESFSAAVPMTLLCAAGALLLAAFAMGAWRGRWNWPALCAALFLLLWMAGLWASTTFFRVYNPATRDNTAYLCRCFSLSALLMYLASRAKRLRVAALGAGGGERGLRRADAGHRPDARSLPRQPERLFARYPLSDHGFCGPACRDGLRVAALARGGAVLPPVRAAERRQPGRAAALYRRVCGR